MSQMEVVVNVLGPPGQDRMVVNVDSLDTPLQQGQLVELAVRWDEQPYASLDQIPAQGLVNSQIVGDVGGALSALVFAHPNAAPAYQITKAAQPPKRGIRVVIHTSDDAHRIPWELLRSDAGFCTLADRVPIVRVAPDRVPRPDAVIIDRRLKLIVVLGASGIDCMPEWLALKRALTTWPHGLEVLVLTYDPTIKDAIDAAPESQGVTSQVDGEQVIRRISAAFIPGSPERLMQIISNEAPQICHFFCHGTSSNLGQLEIAHRGTVAAGDAPLFLERHHLGQLGNSAWLMVLNACETAQVAVNGGGPAAAQANGRDSSFATALIAEGIPYVLGMRQKIASIVVPKFTFAFHDAVLDALNASIRGNGRCLVNLDDALIRGQDAICGHFGNPQQVCVQRQDWSLPVIYKRGKPFFVQALRSQAVGGYEVAVQLVAERAKLKEAREELDRRRIATPSVIQGIEARIAEIEALLGVG
jgi:CHAT domain